MERNVLIDGLFLQRDSYALGVAQAFLQNVGRLRHKIGKIELLVDNPHYARELRALRLTAIKSQLTIRHQAMTSRFLQQTSLPIALYVDRHDFGAYSHYPHFVVVVGRSNGAFSILDPWTGRRKIRQIDELEKSMNTLRNTLKVCPVALKIVDS